jgi:LPS-assembly protein
MSVSTMHRIIILLLALLSAVPAGVRGEEIPITVTADQMTSEGEGDSVIATGNVRITRDDTTLLADTVSFDRTEETAVAEGHVIMERRGDILRGDRVSLNFGTQRGLISHAFLEIKKGGVRVKGDEIEKTGDKEYTVSRGSLTMCEADPPAWRFSASDIDIGENFASGKHVIFSVADVPVFYFPYLIVPVSRERQSGFLLPRLGASSKKGFFLDIPYYFNINPSQEATAYLDIQTKRGAGVGVDYRYLRPNSGSGSANGYMIYDMSQDRFRGMLLEKHQEYFSPSFSLKSSIELTTDQDFFRDFGDASGDYNRQLLETNVFFTKNGEFWSLTPQIKYVYDLNAVNNTGTLQQLPTVSFTGIKRPLLDPLFFSLDSDFTNFYREKGLQGQRLRIAPLLTLYASPSPLLDLSIWGGYRQAIYNTYGAPDNGGTFYGTVTAGAAASSTLTRVYDVNRGSLERVRHVLIPELSYLFVDSFVTIPPSFFDYSDKLTNQNVLTWSVANYLTGRFRTADGTSEYRELLYLKLSQGYDFRQTGQDLLTPGVDTRHFTDLRLETRITPLKNLSLQTDTRFNVYDVRVSSVDVETEYRGDDADTASFGYHYASNSWDYFEARFGVHLTRQILLHYTGRYVVPGSKFLENSVTLEYRHQCWGVAFSYLNRQNNSGFMVSFSLAGIGTIGKTKAY